MAIGILILFFLHFAGADETYNTADPNLYRHSDGARIGGAKIYDEPYEKFKTTDGALVRSNEEIPIPKEKTPKEKKGSKKQNR